MKKGFITQETAILLKSKGFLEATEYYYDIGQDEVKRTPQGEELNEFVWNSLSMSCSAPRQSELQTLLIDEHKIIVEVKVLDGWNDWAYIVLAEDIMSPFFEAAKGIGFETREEAVEKGLQEAIKLLKS